MFLRLRRVVTGVVLACLAVFHGTADAHGYLSEPVSRNALHNSNWCPQCLSGPEPCGDPRGRHDHESRGKYASFSKPPRKYERGSLLTATAVITANHGGRWGLELCASPPEKESCFVRLRRADAEGSYVYLSSRASSSRAKFRLPRDVRCERCVLRWRWETGNSCNPRGTPSQYQNPFVATCKRKSEAETFTNCADIRIS